MDNVVQVNFLTMIHDIEERVSGHESYGNVTEFYDEDGVVLMTVEDSGDGKFGFNFSNGNNFEYSSS